MNFKRYIGALIIVLAFFGAVNQRQSAVPNQEIVIQFNNPEVNSKDASGTIESIKLKLETIGAELIQISELPNNAYKIVYFSTVDVADIKESFVQKDCITIDYHKFNNSDSSSFPNEENDKLSYDLSVYEIQDSQTIGWDFDGVLDSKIEAKSDRFLVRDIHAYSNLQEIRQSNALVKVAYIYYREQALTIQNIPYKIPEVRAGPTFRI